MIYSNNFVYCTATVQLATFRTGLDLHQAKLGLCTPKDETKLLTELLTETKLLTELLTGWIVSGHTASCMLVC